MKGSEKKTKKELHQIAVASIAKPETAHGERARVVTIIQAHINGLTERMEKLYSDKDKMKGIAPKLALQFRMLLKEILEEIRNG